MNQAVSRLALASALSFGIAAPALAQTEEPQTEEPQEERVEDDLHDRQIGYHGNIIVSAVGLEQLDVLAGTSVFEAEDIQRNLDGQIGEVLAKLPGVSATSFSPGASRPILRGFQGERVRVLIDGLGTSDVSNTSVDHATTIDPLTAERVEVLRGPAVLLYGSQAIGGAVNVIDKRIPRRMPEENFHLDALAAWNSAYDLRQGGASLDVPIGPRVVFHVDGSYRETDDLEIAGFQLSDDFRAELLEEAAEEEAEGEFEEAEEFREAADQRGVLPNSATRTWTLNSGLGVVVGESNFGVSIGWYDTNYGVPGRPGMEHVHGEEGEEGEEEEEEGEENVSIDLRQFRADFLGEIALGDGFFEQMKLRAGFSDYTHTEFEGDEVGTVFESEALEARLELVQKDSGPWRGAIGAQYSHRDLFAEGAEAYVPPNVTDQFALFALQEFGTGPFQVEVAGRVELTDVKSQPLAIERSFETYSGALGLVWESDDALRAGVNLTRAERAPSAEELFSNGPHIATQAFEIGDPTLSTESAWGAEGFVRGRLGATQLSLAVFNQWSMTISTSPIPAARMTASRSSSICRMMPTISGSRPRSRIHSSTRVPTGSWPMRARPISAPSLTMDRTFLASRRSACWALWNSKLTHSMRAPKCNGSMTRTMSQHSRRRPMASHWSTYRLPGVPCPAGRTSRCWWVRTTSSM